MVLKVFLVINEVYIDGSVLVASLVGKTRLSHQETKGCRRFMYFICLSNVSVHQHIISILLDFSLTVKAATLLFISGCGSAISSAKEGKSGLIYNFVKSF